MTEPQCIDDILKLNIRDASSLAKKEGVSIMGCRTREEIHDRLIQHYANIPGSSNLPQETEDYGGFLSAQKDTNKVTSKLLDMLKTAEKMTAEFPRKILANLEQSYPSILGQFRERQDSLKKGELWILVAGEVGSGKSSAINLILDCQLLPTDALRCTNTIVEIRCSDRQEAVCYQGTQSDSLERVRKISPKVINLSTQDGVKEFKKCIVESDDAEENPYERIELYYPFKQLSKGVVLVDTPGIEGGNNVDHKLQKYLTRAFGFIYVINTNTAGGVQQSRLGHLLKTVVNCTDDVSPEASLFIANKWENVPDKDKKDVQADIYEKLCKVYPGIKPKQVHYMSVSKSRELVARHSRRTTEHKELLEKIGQLVPNSLRQGLTNQYAWLSVYLNRASYLLRVAGVQHEMSREELERRYEQMQKHVLELQRNSDDTVKRLREKVEFEIYRITNMIKEELISRQFIDYVCNWEDHSDCPAVSRRWKNTADEAAVMISERIAKTLDGWQRQNGILHVIDKEIIKVFTNEFGLLQHQVDDIEEFLTSSRGRSPVLQTVRIVPVRTIFAKKKGKIERTYSTLGGAVSCVGMLDTSKKDVRRLFSNYSERNKAKVMGEATSLYIKSIVEHRDMTAKLKKFFERFFKDIDEAAKRLPVFLQADQQLIETLRHSMNEIEQMRETLPDLLCRCADQHGSLNIFYINDIMKFDYDLQELDWDNKAPLGEGSFAQVYKCEIKRKMRPVAVKVSNDPVRKENVTDILTEDRTMRDLRHPNVVRYYGASYIKTNRGLKFMMVMELCKESLKDYYTGDDPTRERRIPGLIPADHPRRVEAMRIMLNHALDIARGLEYIHDKGYTHRDMKLENVLLANDDTVKITDVGVAKPTNILVRTCNGSPAYMAPEVLLQNKNQTNKIDIYSMSLIFWEMWFGVELTIDMNREILGMGFQGDAMSKLKERMSDPRGGWRPNFRSPHRPSEQLMDIMKRGWHDNPDMRPPVSEFVKTLELTLKNN